MLVLDRITNSDIHTLADFAELLCLLKPDRVLSAEDFDDHLVDACGETRGNRPLGDTFAHMTWRASAFGEHYPFVVASNQQSISASDPLTEQQRVYVFLLLCANLPHVARNEYKQLTDAFERLAHCALRRMWPSTGEVRAFGKNNAQYTGSKAQRMHALALELGCRPNVDSSKFRVGDSGDGGIDLAAWLELDDHEAENKFSALAQCACSRDDWSRKQFEVSFGKLGKLFNPTTPWLELLCIPICFRDNNGRWAVDGDLANVILIDRPRLLRYLDLPADWEAIEPPSILDVFLQERIELV